MSALSIHNHGLENGGKGLPSAEYTIRLCARDYVGQARIDMARRRLKHWDGLTWAASTLPVHEACPDRIHVRPLTDEATDWLAFWILKVDDPHVAISD